MGGGDRDYPTSFRGRSGGGGGRRGGGRDGGQRGSGRGENSGRGGRSGGRGGGRGVDTAMDLPSVLYNAYPFRSGTDERYDMARFVRAAVELNATLLNEFLLRVGHNDAVLDKLRAIAAARFSVSQRTFQEVALPLLTLLGSRAFLDAVHTTDVKRMLRVVLLGEPLFLRRVRSCLEHEAATLFANGLLVESADAVARVLHALVRKLPDCAPDDDVYALICDVREWAHTSEYAEQLTSAAATLDDAMEMCLELVPARRAALQPSRVAVDYLVPGIRTGLTITREAAAGAQVDGFAHGPRHDNDDDDFRGVQVIPTDLEMRCLESPHLPTRSSQAGVANDGSASAAMERHLDLHFRLLREDVLAQIRRGVQWALRPATLAACLRAQQWTPPPREANVPLLNVALDARLEQLHGSIYRGIMFEVSAAQPATLRNKTKEQRKAFWEREQRYKPGSLVCLAVGVGAEHSTTNADDEAFPRYASLGAQELIFATVAQNELTDLFSNAERCSVRLALLDTSRTAELVTTLTNQKLKNILLEVRGLFFTAYEPILRALQVLDARGLGSELQQCLYGGRDGTAWQRKPAYATRLARYDLQFLAKKDASVRVDLSAVPGENYETLVRHLRAYEARGLLTLDASQCEAFAAAMTQQVCLIQGPPGTGKSYVGTKIVRGILNQRVATGPILCVCYTNHALDQFLEGLLDEGLPLDAIVRVGSRSKSERLEPRSLSVLKRDALQSPQERQRFGKLFAECRSIEEQYLDGFVCASTSSSSFLNWMKHNQWDEYAEIVGLEDADGFQEQRQRGHDQRKRWHAWEQGDKNGKDGLWAWPMLKRQQQVAEWEREWRESARASIHVHLDQYKDNVAEAADVNNANVLRILRSCQVVGVTTTGCAIHQSLIRALAPKIVVCEEAGEVLEAHLLACLSEATEQLIQIGDHMQLRPILNEYELSRERESGGPRFDLDVSMFERLVDERARDAAAARAGALVTLHVQRRMRPEICDLIRHTLYPQLEDGPQVLAYPHTRGFAHNLWFLDHDEREDGDALSHTNSFEAELVVELVAYAIKQGYGLDDITILTPYLGQLVKIRGRLQAKNFRFALDDKDVEALHAAGVDDDDDEEDAKQPPTPSPVASGVVVKSLKECVRLSTVDNFQGNESHLVFISTVRSNARGTTGFLKTFNRVNVMLSRAKSAMFLLGSASTVRRSSKATMFNKVLDILEASGAMGRTLGLQCQKHGTVTHVATAQQLRELSPDGGCRVKCDQRLRCGHSCPRLCHADDTRHVAALCLEPCAKRVAVCGHLCKARCHENCRCRETVPEHTLPCGHVLRNVRCADIHSASTTLPCRALVAVTLPFCKHERRVPCAQARALARAVAQSDWEKVWDVNVRCDAVCNGPQECGHACQHACGQCLASNLPATRLLPAPASRTAMAEAAARAQRGDHHFGVCTHKCDRVLLCGHACASFCHAADQCPPCEMPCRTSCAHSKCALRCKEACASCADPCTWSCPHVGACDLPCGSPCTRVPCDLRCRKVLKCGHQCPGLCGEPCLSSAYCRACPPAVATQRDDVVDQVMFTTLADHDPDESPLVRLRCGHCFTVETVDGWLEMEQYYTRDEAANEWQDVKPLRPPQSGDVQVKGCPTCRAPVAGVLRYGRLINFYHLYQSELKYLQQAASEVAASRALRAQHQGQENDGRPTMSSSVRNKLIHAFRGWWTQPTPTQDVLTKESSRLARLGRDDGDSLNLSSFRNIMQRQAVLRCGLELLALLVEKVQAFQVDTSSGDTVLTRTYQEGRQVEARVADMAQATNAQQSGYEAVLLGMELRVAWLQHGRGDEATRKQVLDELTHAKRSLANAPAEMRTRATRLEDMARRVGRLTKAEKDEIFKVFAKGNDAYAQGFGGRWYSCPSGHPYVITECGGAMQEATCPECGAAIGGANHQLNTTNAPATAFFQS